MDIRGDTPAAKAQGIDVIIDPLGSIAQLRLDAAALASMPEGYRHLASIQSRIGDTVKMDMPLLKGPVVEELYRRGARWLAGGILER